jgi:hypothetical protein
MELHLPKWSRRMVVRTTCCCAVTGSGRRVP